MLPTDVPMQTASPTLASICSRPAKLGIVPHFHPGVNVCGVTGLLVVLTGITCSSTATCEVVSFPAERCPTDWESACISHAAMHHLQSSVRRMSVRCCFCCSSNTQGLIRQPLKFSFMFSYPKELIFSEVHVSMKYMKYIQQSLDLCW